MKTHHVDATDFADHYLHIENTDFETSDMGATVHLFGVPSGPCKAIAITIDHQHFSRKDLKELIEFLKSLRRDMKASCAAEASEDL